MKKMFVAVAVAICALVGCKHLPTPETMYTSAKAIGIAAGYAIEMLKIDTQDKCKLVDVLNVVKNVVPATNETYSVAWKNAATVEVDKLVADGKIKESVGKLIVLGATTAGSAVDHLFKKYPEAQKNAEVVQSAIKGVIDGIVTIVKCDDCQDCTFGSKANKGFSDRFDIDYEAYFILSQSLRK